LKTMWLTFAVYVAKRDSRWWKTRREVSLVLSVDEERLGWEDARMRQGATRVE
jgi:hypothetical protein